MSVRVPRHALTFMATAGRLAMKHGLKKGLGKAAAKTNPALMVLEAAVSVADAINSYLKLREAREHRDGLRRLLPHEAQRLRLERDSLQSALDLARAEIDQRQKVQERLGALVLACSLALSTAWEELHAIRASDLPDIEAFDRKVEEMDDAWQQLRRALANYSDSAD